LRGPQEPWQPGGRSGKLCYLYRRVDVKLPCSTASWQAFDGRHAETLNHQALTRGEQYMATANPAANVAIYRRVGYADSATNVMTLNGTVMKTLSLLAILLVTAGISWPEVFAFKAATDAGQAVVPTRLAAYLGIGLIGGLITCMITIFAPRASPITGPLYAALEGLLLGAGSAFFEIRYP